MGSFSEEEQYRFFDAQRDIASISDANSDTSCSNSWSTNWVPDSIYHDGWIRNPKGAEERRDVFYRWMGLNSYQIRRENSVDVKGDDQSRDFDRIRACSGAVLRTISSGNESFSSRSLLSTVSNSSCDALENSVTKEKFLCRDGKLVYKGDCNVEHSDKIKEGHTADLCCGFVRELEAPPSSPSSQQVSEREAKDANGLVGSMKGIKKGWVNRLRTLSCILDRQGIADKFKFKEDYTFLEFRAQRVKVRRCRKRSKELSALYIQQDIQAHEGAILTMKFSPDGQYLASAGEDGIVRIWQVVEDERSSELDILEIDPSCLYFTVNYLSELKPLLVDLDESVKSTSLRKTSDSACVIFPPKVFRILERPLHEFYGHTGEILDLSWSKNNYLLSSSIDNTVRLWQVGCDHCLKVFAHSNYVTCIHFNPVDDDYFISGSIDGKVRIWGIPCCQVVDWFDIREIITAVCYRPDGQGGIAGSIKGNCHLFHLSVNQLQQDALVCLHNKKKAPCKMITGFQFSPLDSSRVMISCADSKIRVLQGLNVIQKYQGLRNAGNHLSAYFAADGKHIVSACEDSNVYIWNCSDSDETLFSQAKKVESSERFYSHASVAIPWNGMRPDNTENGGQIPVAEERLSETLPLSSPPSFTLSQEFILEPFSKVSATWPEEKLPPSIPHTKSTKVHKSQLKFLKTSCQNRSNSHAWGLVIVTAGWDGRIKSFHNYGLPLYL